VTGHYRGAHAGSAAKSGFTCYLSVGCSVSSFCQEFARNASERRVTSTPRQQELKRWMTGS
jgi:hypothetical protein